MGSLPIPRTGLRLRSQLAIPHRICHGRRRRRSHCRRGSRGSFWRRRERGACLRRRSWTCGCPERSNSLARLESNCCSTSSTRSTARRKSGWPTTTSSARISRDPSVFVDPRRAMLGVRLSFYSRTGGTYERPQCGQVLRGIMSSRGVAGMVAAVLAAGVSAAAQQRTFSYTTIDVPGRRPRS